MSIKPFFSDEKTSRHDSDDYKINNNRKLMIVIAALSLIFAIIIWAIAIYVDATSYDFTNVTIEVRNSEAITDAGYRVQLAVETITFKVTGRKSVVNSLRSDSVTPYVDLSGVDTKSERALVDVKFDSKYNLFYSNISSSSVYVSFIDTTQKPQD